MKGFLSQRPDRLSSSAVAAAAAVGNSLRARGKAMPTDRVLLSCDGVKKKLEFERGRRRQAAQSSSNLSRTCSKWRRRRRTTPVGTSAAIRCTEGEEGEDKVEEGRPAGCCPPVLISPGGRISFVLSNAQTCHAHLTRGMTESSRAV